MIALLAVLACGGPVDGAVPEPDRVDSPATVAWTIGEAYPPPEGAARVARDAFGDWIAGRRLAAPDEPIRTHDGGVVHHDGRVVEMAMVRGDLQQCADSAIRLRAEWLRETGGEVSFHATSGDEVPWSRYAGGEVPYEKGKGLAWKAGGSGDWDGYLTRLFTWAGTWSLETYDTVAVDEPRAGDIVVKGGFPGHAVVLLDVAKRGDETLVLVGEGYMPAQQFHVHHGPVDGWFAWTDDGLALPHWPLPADGLRRWK